MLHAPDFIGLSIETAMEVAARHFLRGNVAASVQTASALIRDAFGGDEINFVLERECAALEAWRKKSLPELRGWLKRGGARPN